MENYPLPLKARQFGVSALWSPATYLNSASGFNPVFNGPTEQVYTVEITTMAGCVTVDTQVVKTVKSVEILVPKAFTPNRDGKNDYLRPILLGVKQLNYFKIFNRWGQLIYETKNDQPGWDGRLKGILQSTQVFVWVAEGLGVDNRVYIKKGTSVLIR